MERYVIIEVRTGKFYWSSSVAIERFDSQTATIFADKNEAYRILGVLRNAGYDTELMPFKFNSDR